MLQEPQYTMRFSGSVSKPQMSHSSVASVPTSDRSKDGAGGSGNAARAPANMKDRAETG